MTEWATDRLLAHSKTQNCFCQIGIGAPTSPATHALDVTLYKRTPRRKHPALTVDPPVEAAAVEVAKLGTSDQTPAQLLETSRAAKRARETKKIEVIRRRQGR
jgi:hypothetical protein